MAFRKSVVVCLLFATGYPCFVAAAQAGAKPETNVAVPPLRLKRALQSDPLDEPNAASFSSDETTLAIAGRQTLSANAKGFTGERATWPDVLQLWNSRSGKLIRSFTGKRTGAVRAAVFSPDGSNVYSSKWQAVHDNRMISPRQEYLQCWNITTGKLLYTQTLSSAVLKLAVSPAGKTLAGGCSDGALRVWNATAGKTLQVLRGHRGSVSAVAFSPDGRTLASGDSNGTLQWRDAASGRLLREKQTNRGSIYSIAFSHDGTTLATGSVIWKPRVISEGGISVTEMNITGGVIQLWDARTGASRKRIAVSGLGVYDVAFSPDGKWLAAACGQFQTQLHWLSRDPSKGELRVWDKSGNRLVARSTGAGTGLSVHFSPDGSELLTAGSEAAKIWSVRELNGLQR